MSLGLASGILVGLVSGIGQGVIYGICFTLIYATRSVLRSPSAAIITVEIISWSRIKAFRIGKRGLLIGLIAGLGLGLVYNLQSWLFFEHMGGEAVLSTLVSGLHIALIGGLVGAVVGAVFGGIEPVMRELKTKPNQGIWLSLSNAVLMGAIGGLLMGLVMAGISSMSIQDTGLAFLIGLIFGLLTAIALGGWFGGIDVAEHAVLRLILARKGYAPLNYARFLDYAADELNFLQKVGGGYIFIHRYLLEYFAAMY